MLIGVNGRIAAYRLPTEDGLPPKSMMTATPRGPFKAEMGVRARQLLEDALEEGAGTREGRARVLRRGGGGGFLIGWL